MVVRVEGIVNRDPIIFSRLVGDQWTARAPSNISGTYVLEMIAYDEAGNIAHISKYIMMYDPINMCACLIPCPYISEVEISDYATDVYVSDYYSELLIPPECGGCGR